ncbi:hypothetical protein CBR_g37271 [Chara braunii]|uniref:Uncharacterized protein n=1 Tax=Chara braunii TaxID=69332 RepID=A0A388LMN5_CHABU|nr:hypothetical protein CBR_g37271 [Chara braunii]|eukprot:GBG83554.1 hypothetical protein CBR_g37271 [Chara braunii]
MWRTCHVAMGEGWQRRDGNAEVATPRGDGSGMATPRWRWDRERDREAKVATGVGSGSETGGGDGYHTSHVPNIARGALSASPHGVPAPSSSPTWQVRRWRRRGGNGSGMATSRWRRHLGVEVAYLPHHLVPRASAEVATPRWRRERQVRHVASAASPYSPTWQVLRWRQEQQVRHMASAASPYSPTWQVRRWRRIGGDGSGIRKRRWRRRAWYRERDWEAKVAMQGAGSVAGSGSGGGDAKVATQGTGSGSGFEGGDGSGIGIGKRKCRWVPHFARAKHRTWRTCHVAHFPHHVKVAARSPSNQSINQSIHQSIHQSINQSIN